ncbi:MAG TPA: GH1 family beta-glucosidase [Streptosporangiaceae bacterium]|jgi:beta-glucosidase|nr:GH1 family beta-glucosidase [Streptosporangiaceae bacterium]
MSTDGFSQMTGHRRFPDSFLWGVSTAAYQIEGAAAEAGRGPSIWDTFSHTPGKVRRGDTGDIACDAYHRLDADLDLLADLGVRAYRFSIAWPRIVPAGSGEVNQQGLDYYRRLVTGLRERDIEPVATLYHWDLPQPLEDAGGWPRRDTAERFAEYTAITARALGDGVGRWITLNEPYVVANHGYRVGTHAPGRRDEAAAAAATHHLLLGHGLALQALRAELGPDKPVGFTLNLTVVRATSDQAKAAAEEIEAEQNQVFLDPVISGRYPVGAVRPSLLPGPELIRDGDLDIISAPIDFLGVNYYRPGTVGWRDEEDELRRGEERISGYPGAVSVVRDGTPRNSMGWPIDASGLYDLLVQLRDRVPGLPLYVTENGMAAEDYVDPEGGVDDQERITYLTDHLDAAARAIDAGVDLRGYFCWSFLDNFEWAEGYQKRFGLVYVDYGTQQRIPKASAAFYSAVVRANALP